MDAALQKFKGTDNSLQNMKLTKLIVIEDTFKKIADDIYKLQQEKPYIFQKLPENF